LHAEIAAFFAEEAAAGRITKKQLANLIEKNPAQITRWLTEPSNYEADTISDILLAMGAEMDHRVVRFSERGKQNYVHPVADVIIGLPTKQRPANAPSWANTKIVATTSQTAKLEYLIAAE